MTLSERLDDAYKSWALAIQTMRERGIRAGRLRPVLDHEFSLVPNQEEDDDEDSPRRLPELRTTKNI